MPVRSDTDAATPPGAAHEGWVSRADGLGVGTSAAGLLADGTVRLDAALPPFAPQLRTDAAEPAWQHRVDRGELLAMHVRPDGTLLAEGYAAREGVLEYRRGDTVVRELVTADALASAARGLARAVVTLEHPDPGAYPDGVTTTNVDRLGVGDTDGEVLVEDGGFVKVKMAIRRKDAIDAVQAGKQELSPGYAVRLDPTPGTHPVHGRYDAVQVERRYNHLAIVDRARGGSEVRLRADSAVATSVISGASPITPSGAKPHGALVKPGITRLLALLGVTSRVDGDDAAIDAACNVLEQRKDAADRADAAHATALAGANTATATEKARADSEKLRADRAEAEVATLKAAEATRLDAVARTELDALATGMGLDPKTFADTKAARRAIAGKHLGSEIKADASDAYIQALVDIAKADAASDKRGDGREAGRKAFAPTEPAPANGQRVDGQPARRVSTMNDRWSGQPVSRGGV